MGLATDQIDDKMLHCRVSSKQRFKSTEAAAVDLVSLAKIVFILHANLECLVKMHVRSLKVTKPRQMYKKLRVLNLILLKKKTYK